MRERWIAVTFAPTWRSRLRTIWVMLTCATVTYRFNEDNNFTITLSRDVELDETRPRFKCDRN